MRRFAGSIWLVVVLAVTACTGGTGEDRSAATLPGLSPGATTATAAPRPTLDPDEPVVCRLPDARAAVPHRGSWAPAPASIAGFSRVAYTEGDRLILSTEGGPAEFITGVNLGATVPNHAPGELALTADDYRRWFPLIAELGFRAIRIYTIHPPEFYEELAAYNLAHPLAPLYLMHGVWIPEEAFLAEQDLFAADVVSEMQASIDDAVAVVSGDADLPERLGHAEGSYRTDVTPWLYAWSIGVEWDPIATARSNEKNAGRMPYAGTWFESAPGANPTEVWLSIMLDHLAGELVDAGVVMPLSFVNWPTTDPLHHPDEPLPEEDLVGVDANAVRPKEAWLGGYFAAYHAYPYYPDFQRYEQGIADCVFRGEVDPYAGYLMALRNHHAGLPVVVNEFGVPSSAAMAHLGPLGRDQGDHSEQEAMAINADMLQIIRDLGFSGGYVFEWADEWFKFTWNTIDYELPPNRRSLWMNPWTNEAHFGVLAVEPGKSMVVVVDGDGSEWTSNASQVIYESLRGVREIRAVKDPGYLYLRLVVDGTEAWESSPITLGFDVISGGRDGLPGLPEAPGGADYAIVIGVNSEARAWVRASNDQHAIRYGLIREYVPVDRVDLREGSGVWFPYKLITNRPQTIPTTGVEYPAEVFDASLLRFGTSNPADPAFDNRTMWSARGNIVELRVPYQAIGISDPSSRLAYRINPDGSVVTEPFARVGITVTMSGTTDETAGYSWSPWQRAEFHERIKAGASGFAEVITAITGG